MAISAGALGREFREGCNGPAGNQSGAALITRIKDERTTFSIEDRSGNFRDNEGFFEFDVRLR